MASKTKHTPQSVLKAFYAAELQFTQANESERDFGPVAATLSSDIQLKQTSGLPYPGIYVGPEGMLQWMTDASKWFSKIDVQGSKIFSAEDSDELIVLSTVHFRVRATGEDIQYPLIQHVAVDVEKGVLTKMEPWYYDVHDLNKKLGFDPDAKK